MSDAAPREWRFYIDDMIAFAGKVLAYTKDQGPRSGDVQRRRTELRRNRAQPRVDRRGGHPYPRGDIPALLEKLDALKSGLR